MARRERTMNPPSTGSGAPRLSDAAPAAPAAPMGAAPTRGPAAAPIRGARATDHPIPAIIVARGPTALGALRCLHMAAIPAFSACPAGDLASRSRWYRPAPGPLGWDGTPGAPGLAALRQLPLDAAVLIPGADDIALWLADLPADAIGTRFRVSSSSRASLEILQDKKRFGQFLAGAGVPHPRTFPLERDSDLQRIPLDELDRAFLKPADSRRFNAITGVKGMWANGRAEFERLWQQLAQQDLKVIVQEYIPGPSSEHYFIDGFRDRHGRLTGLLARRRLRIFPPDFGNSSYCESIALTQVAQAAESLETILAQLQYRGIFSAEFKRDSRDGLFKILEINTRAWWYVEFAARCGVNVCEMAWQDALDLPVTQASRAYRMGAGCLNLHDDLAAVTALPAATRGPWSRILRQWSRSYLHVFRLDDPLPAMFLCAHLLKGRWRRLTGRRQPPAGAAPVQALRKPPRDRGTGDP